MHNSAYYNRFYKNKQNLADRGDIAKKFVNNLINIR